jgi:anti-sigma B factor antagonist
MSESPTTQEFKFQVTQEGDIHLVTIQGSLADDANNTAKEGFLQLLNDKPSRIVVDLEGMDYISSSGIGVLVSVLRRCRQSGFSLVICSLRPEIYELFKLTRLIQIFEIHENRDQALRSC